MAHRRPLVLLLALPLALSACGGSGSGSGPGSGAGAAEKAHEVKLQLTDSGCTPATVKVPSGAVRISVSNPGTSKTDEIELKNADGIILGERENIAPGLGTDFSLTLQPGSYVLNCTFQNDQRDNGRVIVTGAATQVAAKTDDPQLVAAVATYKRYVKRQTTALVASTQRFTDALDSGRTARAKALFGPTRAHYEAIEPIAESFGNLDPEIDARVNDVAGSDTWTGFHRIEQTLWREGTTKGTAPYATKLLADVKTLDDKVDALTLQPAQIANGAVGLLDEISASKITGEEDRYSHTDLSDFQANFTGAAQAFDALAPALRARGDGALVGQVQRQIAAVQGGLDAYRRHDALGFAAYSELSGADRRRFAQQIAALAEPLSLVAGKVLVAAHP
jgi:iron uptake system component EfeO